MKKALIVGLDGGTFRAIKKYADQGLLPTFKHILEKGSHGILKSTIPFLTVPAWPSFYTGCNPGKHGIFHFLSTHKFNIEDRKIHTFSDVNTKSLWKILSENGKRCLVWNVPMTYPPEEINGKLVGGLLSLSSRRYAYPLSFEEELRKQNYVIDSMELNLRHKGGEERFDAMVSVDKARYEMWKKYYNAEKWDFSMIVFRCSDICGHDFWQDEEKVIRTYKTLDDLMAKVLKQMDNETGLFVMSDHGFNTYEKTFNIMAWLHNEGYLKYAKSEINDVVSKGWRQVHEKQGNTSLLRRFFHLIKFDRQKLFKNKFIDKFRNFVPRSIKNIVRENIPQSTKTIDWKNTTAYAQLGAKSTWGVNINLVGRENDGIVTKEKYNKLRSEIIEKLKLITDPAGEKIFTEVIPCEEEYHGKFIAEAPDIIFKVNGEKRLAVARFDNKLFVETTSHTNSYHDRDGIFMALGPNIKEGLEIKPISILDITPTVLNYMGLSVPEYMDGKPAKQIYDASGVNLGVVQNNVRGYRY